MSFIRMKNMLVTSVRGRDYYERLQTHPKKNYPQRGSRKQWIVFTAGALGVFTILGVFSLFFLRRNIDTEPDPKPIIYLHADIDALYAWQSTSLAQAAARYTLRSARAPPPNYARWYDFAAERRCLIDEYDNVHRDFEPVLPASARGPGVFFGGWWKRQCRWWAIKDDHGMKAFRVEGGMVRMLDERGSAYNDGWMKTLGELAPLIPDTTLLLNHRDEPRVAFDPSVPCARRAVAARDPQRAQHVRRHAVPALALAHGKGFMTYANDASSFLLYSASADFSTDAYPVLSQAKIRPCFADIMFPSEYHYPRSGSSPKYAFPNNVSWADKKGELCALPVLLVSALYCVPAFLVSALYRCLSFYSLLLPRTVPLHAYYRLSSAHADSPTLPRTLTPPTDWRGQSTGGWISGTNYRSFPRFRLIDIARKDPRAKGIMDVAITAFYAWFCRLDGCDGAAISAEYDIINSNAPREAAYTYKYLFDVDGNGFSGRYLGLMRSGGLVFKSTVFNEYFDAWLRPYEHYIPVLPDLSDLVDKVLWARKNDGEARRIQAGCFFAAGQAFVERVLTDGQNDCYFLLVLLEWARLWAGGDGT
ncbi:hypothetical protein C8J57DRAFT_1582083 [Mycena rebaudengoi]|nr:hypothetical protein C8J57DRAFT_1582083 [Mycena rebaudengoi]